MPNIEDDETNTKRICHFCISEPYLSNEVRTTWQEAECDYCSKNAPSIEINVLAERIEGAFADHYVRTSDQPEWWQERLLADRESNYNWRREGAPVCEAIQWATGIDESPAADLLEVLNEKHATYPDQESIGEESEFSSESYYKPKRPTFIGLHMGWHEFEHTLKTKARYFSRSAEELLIRIFGSIDKLKTREGLPLVVNVGPGTKLDHLYRSRVFQAEDGLKDALCRPDDCIGSPPPKLARAGRMNAQGISVFYGALEKDTAIAEVRPPVGSRLIVARFNILRPLRLLDLTAVNEVHEEGSIFDSFFIERLHRADFLRSLGQRMTRSVMPDDEGLDYLPTQAVSDFLATTNKPTLDGIIFPSAQVETGYNVVLFHEAARVKIEEIPKGTKIEADVGRNSEDGWEDDYFVTETLPLLGASEAEYQEKGFPGNVFYTEQSTERALEYRRETLRLVTESVEVHHVTWAKVTTKRYCVSRFRRE